MDKVSESWPIYSTLITWALIAAAGYAQYQVGAYRVASLETDVSQLQVSAEQNRVAVTRLEGDVEAIREELGQRGDWMDQDKQLMQQVLIELRELQTIVRRLEK